MAQQPTGLDFSAINPYGAKTADLEEWQNALKAGADALEQRYANPNWFNVAAGFLKPQLGGFAASLGSAGAALGDNLEKQRANELPVAQMRAQLAQSKIVMGQKQAGAEKLDAILGTGAGKGAEALTGGKLTPDQIRKISPVDIASLYANEATRAYAEALKNMQEAQIKADTQTRDNAAAVRDEQISVARNPATATNIDKVLQSGVSGNENKRLEYIAKVKTARPPNIDEATWEATPIFNQIDEIARYNAEISTKGMEAEAGDAKTAAAAHQRLPLLRTMREMALKPGMRKMFDYFGSNNMVDVLGQAATDGKFLEVLRGVDEYMKQFDSTPEVRTNAQILGKLIAENQASMRSATTHPTDAAQTLLQTASPTFRNSQTAFVSLVDLIGHSEKHAVDMYNLRMSGGPDGKTIPARALQNSSEYYAAQQKYQDSRAQILREDPTVSTPSWYSSKPTAVPGNSPPIAKTVASTATPTPTATASATPTAAKAPSAAPATPKGSMQSMIEAEIARRNAAVGARQ
jgi:hypothetical protein